MTSSALKTITLTPVEGASIELAAKLKQEFGWLNSEPDILRMLSAGWPVHVIEHLRPAYVATITTKLDALGLEYTVAHE